MVDKIRRSTYEADGSYEIGTFKRYKEAFFDDENDKITVRDVWSVILFRIDSHSPVTETDIVCVWVPRFHDDTDVWI